jgi:hypothetical protein
MAGDDHFCASDATSKATINFQSDERAQEPNRFELLEL